MNLAVKLDEDLSLLVAEPLETAGYTVRTVVGQGFGGLKDSELWKKVSAERVFFITADKGFADLRSYPPGTHAGILLLRPARESVVDYRSLLTTVLAEHALTALVATISVATPRGVRIRRAPV